MSTVTHINSNYKSVIDKTIELYGDLSYMFKLIEDNGLTGITSFVQAGTPLTYDDKIVFIDKTKVAPVDVTATAQTLTYRIQENQTVFDVALQLYGTIETVFDLCDRSGIDNLNSDNLKNVSAVYTEQKLATTTYYKRNNITVATAKRTSDGTLNRSFDLSFDLSFG